MKINQNKVGAAGNSETNPANLGKSGRAGESAASRSGPTDQIQLSSLSRQVSVLSANSPEREAHVEGIAVQYVAGRYQGDPEQAAQGVIHEALSVGNG
jgi:anti-sigma28 factor (negative regulator of flagellin synthesis)